MNVFQSALEERSSHRNFRPARPIVREAINEETVAFGCCVRRTRQWFRAGCGSQFKPGEDSKFNWASYDAYKKAHGDLKGETLTIFGPWRGEDEKLATSVLNYFSEATGVTVKYSSSENYEQQIVIDTQAGSPPNIAILPQPGLLADLASKGFLTPLSDDQAKWVKDNNGAASPGSISAPTRGRTARRHSSHFPTRPI